MILPVGTVLLCESDQRLYEVISHKISYGDVVAVAVQPRPPYLREEIEAMVRGYRLDEEVVSLVKIQAGQWRVLSPLEQLAREG